MTEFVLETVEPVAEALLERDRIIQLSQEEWRRFVEEVESPSPWPEETIKDAARFLREFHPEALAPNAS